MHSIESKSFSEANIQSEGKATQSSQEDKKQTEKTDMEKQEKGSSEADSLLTAGLKSPLNRKAKRHSLTKIASKHKRKKWEQRSGKPALTPRISRKGNKMRGGRDAE
jgi:hypothetical protein